MICRLNRSLVLLVAGAARLLSVHWHLSLGFIRLWVLRLGFFAWGPSAPFAPTPLGDACNAVSSKFVYMKTDVMHSPPARVSKYMTLIVVHFSVVLCCCLIVNDMSLCCAFSGLCRLNIIGFAT